MAKLTLPDIGTLSNQSSAREAMNNNFDLIEEALENTLSRDGTTPNQMEADLDLNSNSIINVADPVADGDAVNKRSVGALVDEYASVIAETLIEGTARVDVFTATALQTEFTLSDAPSGVDAMFVYDDGVAMVPGVDFTLTGTTLQTLEFFVGRVVGHTIVARYVQLSPADSLLRADLATETTAKGAAIVTFTPSHTGAVARTVSSKIGEKLSPKDFGAVGDAVTDDTDAIRAMFAAADAISADPNYVHGGMVEIPPGSYGISDTITLTRPPMVVGAGYAERSTSALGAGRGITQFVALAGLAGKPMFRLISPTASEVLHGGKFLGINLLGMDIASYGIWGSSLSHCDFDVRAFRFTTAGVRLDDGNGALSDRNTFDVHYVWGTNAACIGSHGLWIKGDNAGAPGTGNPQNIVKRLDGLTKNGDGLRLEGDVDNTVIQHSAMALEAGGTGRNMAFLVTTGTPRVNFCLYTAGGLIQLDPGTYGNTFHTSSEGTTFTGGGLYDLVTTDYGSGGFWQTRRHYLSDRIQFSGEEFSAHTGAVARAVNGDTIGWGFDAAADEGVVAQRVIPITWRNGSITSINLRFVMLGAQAGGAAVRWQVRLKSVSTDEIITITNTEAATVGLTSLAANTMNLATLTLTTPENITAGDMLILQVLRLGTHAGDTATGDAMLYSAEAAFVSLGPQSGGSGVIQVPGMGS